jgi:hypothetical protein
MKPEIERKILEADMICDCLAIKQDDDGNLIFVQWMMPN